MKNKIKFPQNKFGIKYCATLISNDDQLWCGLMMGDTFQITYDGKFVKSGGLSWSIDQIMNEIDKDFWTIRSID